jgi:membrane-associated phospholipid phosphatase
MINMANMANASTVANPSGVAGTWTFADRVDLPFVTIHSDGPNHPHEALAKLAVPLSAFRERDWTADWFGWRVVADIASTQGTPPAWQSFDLLPSWAAGTPPEWGSAAIFPHVQEELAALVTAAQNERADALGEIVGQSEEFISYFLALLDASPTGYTRTVRALTAAQSAGLLAAMFYKQKYQRPRPAQVLPALLPPLATPGHASLPSGHSTQAHLIALVVADIVAGTTGADNIADAAWRLADRIARNREIAGFHYRSDSDAGRTLAHGLHDLLAGAAPISPNFTAALNDAKAEWAGR